MLAFPSSLGTKTQAYSLDSTNHCNNEAANIRIKDIQLITAEKKETKILRL